MKKLFTIFFLIVSLKSLAQQKTGADGANHATGAYAPIVQKETKGFAGSVATTTDRNNIPSYLRDTGMIVAVRSDSTLWTLAGGTANANWMLITKSTSGATPPAEIDTTVTVSHALQIVIPHGQGAELTETPSVQVNDSAAGDFGITSDATNIYLDYPISISGIFNYHIVIRK